MRIRGKIRAKAMVSPAEKDWLDDYEKTNQENRGEGSAGRSRQASHKESHTIETHAAESEGTGIAAAAAAGAMVREEGLMLASLADRGIQSLIEAVKCYKGMCLSLLEERKQDATVQRALVEAVRTHYIARAEAEADLVKQEADHNAASGDGGDPLEKAALEALVQKFVDSGGSIPTAGSSGNGRKR